MARVQLVIPDDDHDRFVRQAHREGLSFSAWLRAAASQRLEERRRSDSFTSQAQLEEFFTECDTLNGPDREPDWEDHLRTIEESRNVLR